MTFPTWKGSVAKNFFRETSNLIPLMLLRAFQLSQGMAPVRNVTKPRAYLLVLLLLGSCSDSALTDDETLDFSHLKKSGKEGDELLYAPDAKLPYTGWAKSMHNAEQAEYLAHFKDGVLDGRWTEWREDGEKAQEGTYKAGREDGIWTKWYGNGEKESERNFKDGVEEGTWIDWHENGTKAEERHYADGKLHGPWINWDESGKEWQRSTYKNGVEVED